jgi:hypothetical protein
MASIITAIQSKLGYSSQKALMLGAGFVTKPTVEILANAGVEVTVGERAPRITSNKHLTDRFQPAER